MKAIRITRWILAIAAAATMAGASEPTPDTHGVYLPGLGVNAPKLVHGAPAPYPSDPELAAGAKHICTLIIVIGEDGIPRSIQLANTHGSPFDGPAIAAVKQSEFKAGSLHGKPVPVRIQIVVPFLSKADSALPEISSMQHVNPPIPTYTPEAKIPDAAKRKKLMGGNVMIQGIVDEDGKFQNAHVVRSTDALLEANALEAVG